MHVPVIIVGAGPTGLTAAALLARSGIPVRLFDKSEKQAQESRAFGVHAKTMELFFSMGLAEEFLKRGLIAAGVQIFVNGKQAGELNFDAIHREDTPYPFLLMVPQWDIEDILVQDLKKFNISVEHNTEITDFQTTDNHIEVHTKNDLFTCDYLIGADGAHSIVRKKLKLDFIGAPYQHGFLLADCKIEWPLDYEHMKLFLREKNLVFYLPLRGKDFCRIIALQPVTEKKEDTQSSESVPLEEIQNVLNAAAGGIPIKLSDPVWTSRYRIHHRAVNHYSVGRVFLAGDAAHIHSPAGAQGMNTGVQDAANLAWKLAVAIRQKSEKILKTYHDERWPVGQKILKYTDNLFSYMTTQTTAGAWLRNHLIPILGNILLRIPAFRYRLFHFISQLGIRYRSSEIAVDDVSQKWYPTLSAGHRAPNALIKKDFDVFDLIRGYFFHVIIFSKKALSSDEIKTLHEHCENIPKNIGLPVKTHIVAESLTGEDPRITRVEISQIFDVYGLNSKVPQAIFLIRPDGYIGYRQDGIDIEKLCANFKSHPHCDDR